MNTQETFITRNGTVAYLIKRGISQFSYTRQNRRITYSSNIYEIQAIFSFFTSPTLVLGEPAPTVSSKAIIAEIGTVKEGEISFV